jgi:hypothetical protein
MDDKQPLKQRLPFPFNQDLSQVVRHLDRRTVAARERLANDPVTAAYLAAAMRLIERFIGPCAERILVDPDDENSVERPMLGFLSQRAVAAEVANNPAPFPRKGNVSTMRSTWRSHSDFIADLLSFGLWSQSGPAVWESDAVKAAARDLEAGVHFDQVVHELAYWYMVVLIARPRFRLELVAAAAAEGDKVTRAAMAEHYTGVLEPWKPLLANILRARGLRLRSGISPDDFINLLVALVEGSALRSLANPDAVVVDHQKHRSLLGTAVLALISGCLERDRDGPGVSIEDAVNMLVRGGDESSRSVPA